MIKKYVSWLLLVVLATLSGGCTEEGTNTGDASILLNASMLKGALQNSVVRVYDHQGNWLWEGRTQEDGLINIPLRPSVLGDISIEATTDTATTMLCDAAECRDNTSSTPYQFGDMVQPGSLTGLSVSTVVSLEQGKAPPALSQANTMTHLTRNFIRSSASDTVDIDQYGYSRYMAWGSKVVTSSLGVVMPSNLNLFSAPLVDINKAKQFSQMNQDLLMLSLVNASFAADIEWVDAYSNALEAFAREPNNLEAQSRLESLQKQVLAETMRITQLPSMQALPAAIAEQTELAATAPLDFSGITDAISEVTEPGEPGNGEHPEVKEILSSSNHWQPNKDNVRANNWWWVSEFNTGRNEWIALDFTSPVNTGFMKLGIDGVLQGYNLTLQGKRDQSVNWESISTEISSYLEEHGTTDEKNVVSLSWQLPERQDYTALRLLSPPTNAIWLEYLCFYAEAPPENDVCTGDAHHQPDKVSVSSLRFMAEHVTNPTSSQFWVSSMASGKAEWLDVHYFQPFAADSVEITANVNYMGESPVIQGYSDTGDWQTLLTLDLASLSEQADDQGFVAVSLPLASNPGFKRYRYYSEPTSFVWIKSLIFM